MPGPRSRDADQEDLAASSALERELDPAAARVLERVARDLGDRRGEPGLVLGVEAEQRGDLPGALARQHDVVLEPDRDREQRAAHAAPRARRDHGDVVVAPRVKSR